MKFKTRNYRAIKTADIETTGELTFIGGCNGAGKTSLLDALRCAVTGNANPFPEITKKQSSMLVHSGTPSGMTKMISGDNELNIEYPEQKITIDGIVPAISEYSAGVKTLVDMKPNERLRYISDIIKSSPTDIDLISAIKKAKIFPESATIGTMKSFQTLWENISLNGWDNTLRWLKEKGAEYKGVWQYVTGISKYGKNIAEQWFPDSWTPGLETATLEYLSAEYLRAEKEYNAIAECNIIENSLKEELTELVSHTNKETVKNEMDAISEQDSHLEREIIKLRNLNRTDEKRGLLCPKCNTKLTFTNGELKLIPQNEETHDYTKDISDLKEQQKKILIQFGEKRSLFQQIEAAEKKLSNTSNKPVDDNIKIEFEKSRDNLEAFKKYHEAQNINKRIINNKILQDIISPSGIRAEKLKKSLDRINKSAKLLCSYGDWDPVEIYPDGIITYKGIPYSRFIAKSERYRTRVILQLIFAMAEKSPLVIIDDADELTRPVRNGLIKILLKSKKHCIVACALKEIQDMPNFKKFGNTYWVENGSVLNDEEITRMKNC